MDSTPELIDDGLGTSVVLHLKRIEGQVRGLQQMVEHDRTLVEVVTQISSVRHSLEAVAYRLLKQELERCAGAHAQTSPDDLVRALKLLRG